jgi:sugar/nucleoside kinase (ribokinase family)
VPTPRKTLVFGPAYVDRVLKVDRPLVESGVIDRSVNGRWDVASGPAGELQVAGLPEGNLRIEPPADWPGPTGTVIVGDASGEHPLREVRGIAWHDDLGGMGAGFARAFGGTLHLMLGDESEPIGRRVIELLDGLGIAHNATHIPGRLGEWTLLITSGEFGDKLPIGFRDPGTHGAMTGRLDPCDLLVAASMTNRRAAAALAGVEARVRVFAPAMRNVTDTDPKVSAFVRDLDILCCNRAEWESIADREEVAWRVSILAVTDGPRGAEIRYTTPTGDAGRLEIPAFLRREPPKDTNRAGEAFASTLVTTLLDGKWSPGTTEEGLIRKAAERASAAAALVLDRVDFGFPTSAEVDRALHQGVV